MAALTVQTNALAGVVTTTTAAAGGGDTFANNGKAILEVTNGSGSSITVTVTSKATADRPGLVVTDLTGAVAAGATKRFGPFDTRSFNDPTTGLVSVGYSSATTVTVAVIAQA